MPVVLYFMLFETVLYILKYNTYLVILFSPTPHFLHWRLTVASPGSHASRNGRYSHESETTPVFAATSRSEKFLVICAPNRAQYWGVLSLVDLTLCYTLRTINGWMTSREGPGVTLGSWAHAGFWRGNCLLWLAFDDRAPSKGGTVALRPDNTRLGKRLQGRRLTVSLSKAGLSPKPHSNLSKERTHEIVQQ